jgi:hypothetical protein
VRLGRENRNELRSFYVIFSNVGADITRCANFSWIMIPKERIRGYSGMTIRETDHTMA